MSPFLGLSKPWILGKDKRLDKQIIVCIFLDIGNFRVSASPVIVRYQLVDESLCHDALYHQAVPIDVKQTNAVCYYYSFYEQILVAAGPKNRRQSSTEKWQKWLQEVSRK